MARDDLPIADVLDDVVAAVRGRGVAVVEAPPGAGKTTRVPPALLDAVDGRVVVLEPRRVAARAAATRMASEHGESLGGLVGLTTGDDRQVSRRTRIEVVTEGVLVRRLQADPSLPGIGNDIHRADGEPEWCYDRIPLRALASQTQLWRRTVADLDRVRMPVLLAHSTQDHVVPASSWQLFDRRVGSRDVTRLELTRSFHVATLDDDAQLLQQEAVAFVSRIAAGVTRTDAEVPDGR